MSRRSGWRSLVLWSATLALPWLTGCGAGNPNANDEFTTVLSGNQMVPRRVTSAQGTAVISTTAHMVSLILNTSGVVQPTAVTVRLASVGATGQVLFNLWNPSDPGFGSTLLVNAGPARFSPAGGITTFAAAEAAIADGRCYLQVETAAHPEGEIRGQIGRARLRATCTAANVAPPTTSAATANGVITLTRSQSGFRLQLDSTGLTSPPRVTRVVVRLGEPGINGPPIWQAFGSPPSTFTNPLDVGPGLASFIPQPTAGISTSAEAIDAMLSGRAYLSIETSTVPSGELRGPLTGA